MEEWAPGGNSGIIITGIFSRYEDLWNNEQMSEREEIDEILGITRCVRCGHRLDGNIECPFCSVVLEEKERQPHQKWVYLTACFLTSPLSLYAILNTERLSLREKVLAFSGCLFWFCLYFILF